MGRREEGHWGGCEVGVTVGVGRGEGGHIQGGFCYCQEGLDEARGISGGHLGSLRGLRSLRRGLGGLGGGSYVPVWGVHGVADPTLMFVWARHVCVLVGGCLLLGGVILF